MSRKLMLGLWVSVWPAVALITPFVWSQVPRPVASSTVAPSTVTNHTIEKTGRRSTTSDSQSNSDDRVFSEVAPQTAAPIPTSSGRATTDSGEPGRRIDQRTPDTIRRSSDTDAFENSEPLPPTRDAVNATPARSRPRVNYVRSRTNSSELSQQEEQAQKLIYERAMLRAQQRHSRLETRQWEKLGRRPPTRPLGGRSRSHTATALAKTTGAANSR